MAGTEARRVAAIDCGTNSIRLLIADVTSASEAAPSVLSDVDRRMTVVRLGEGVDTSGEFSPAALERTFAAVEDYAARIAAHGAERVRFVATSASRDAANRDEFLSGVTERVRAAVPDFDGPEVVDGDEEAALSFAAPRACSTGMLCSPPIRRGRCSSSISAGIHRVRPGNSSRS